MIFDHPLTPGYALPAGSRAVGELGTNAIPTRQPDLAAMGVLRLATGLSSAQVDGVAVGSELCRSK